MFIYYVFMFIDYVYVLRLLIMYVFYVIMFYLLCSSYSRYNSCPYTSSYWFAVLSACSKRGIGYAWCCALSLVSSVCAFAVFLLVLRAARVAKGHITHCKLQYTADIRIGEAVAAVVVVCIIITTRCVPHHTSLLYTIIVRHHLAASSSITIVSHTHH